LIGERLAVSLPGGGLKVRLARQLAGIRGNGPWVSSVRQLLTLFRKLTALNLLTGLFVTEAGVCGSNFGCSLRSFVGNNVVLRRAVSKLLTLLTLLTGLRRLVRSGIDRR